MEHVNILMTMITDGGCGGEKGGVTQQSALHCLKQLITRIGDTHPQEFVSVRRLMIHVFLFYHGLNVPVHVHTLNK